LSEGAKATISFDLCRGTEMDEGEPLFGPIKLMITGFFCNHHSLACLLDMNVINGINIILTT
jgi:hypothetical protein